jgi:hypothetical protein
MLAGGALTSVAQIVLPKPKQPSQLPRIQPLSFVDVSGLGPPQAGEFVENTYCPLHKEKIVPNAAIPLSQRNSVESQLKQELAKAGTPWDSTFKVLWTSQHYGVPASSPLSEQLLNYCMRAEDFLHRRVEGLLPVAPAWQALHQGACPEVNGNSFKAFVGRYTYLIIRIQAVNANNEPQIPYLIDACPLERSLNFICADPKTYLPNKSTIYIIPGLTSLCSPFSELLHLSTNQPALRYSKQLAENTDNLTAQEQGCLLGETVTEAMAIVLAQEFLQANHYVQRLDQLHILAQHIHEYLPHLDKALAFCYRQGVQECFDTFRQDPELLNKKIHQIQG